MAANSLIDAHGIDASMRNGVYETNGASTLVVTRPAAS